MIADLRYLCYEISPECNYSMLHPWCPNSSRIMPHNIMIDDVVMEEFTKACVLRGFSGLIGFHYYNEPTLELDRMLKFIRHHPEWRYVLWTNGSQLDVTSRNWLSLFEQVSVSAYSTGDVTRLESITQGLPNCHVEQVTPDRRMDVYGCDTNEPGGCIRPKTIELAVDAWGRVHLCCTDYNCVIEIGNIITHDHTTVINNFLLAAREAELGNIPLCQKCRTVHSPCIRR
jgi:hypothetical protein